MKKDTLSGEENKLIKESELLKIFQKQSESIVELQFRELTY